MEIADWTVPIYSRRCLLIINEQLTNNYYFAAVVYARRSTDPDDKLCEDRSREFYICATVADVPVVKRTRDVSYSVLQASCISLHERSRPVA